MKNEIFSVTQDYLNNPKTDYALMVYGSWGSGKTHFVKNELFNFIKEIPKETITTSKRHICKTNTVVYYNPIYISLYGLDSIDNIYTKIVSSIFPILNNRLLLLAKAGLNGLAEFKGINTDELKQIKFFKGITNKDVLFFDDLERIDNNKIDIQSVLGYLNYLSEHCHHKVIVIANEENITNNYLQFKEKTIRYSLNYTPNLNEVYDSVSQRYESDYFDFLTTQKNLILNIFNARKYRNIRTLIFITDTFRNLFFTQTDKYQNEINKEILTIYTIIAIEAKEGHTSEELQESLPQTESLSLSESFDIGLLNEKAENITQNDAVKEMYDKTLRDCYHKFLDNITFFPELINYVFDGYIQTSVLNRIIETIRNKYIQQEIPEFQTYAKRIFNWTTIPDNEFNNTIKCIKKSLADCLFGVNDILRIYASFIHIESMNIDDFKITEKDNLSFKKAIDAAMKDLEYLPYFDMQITIWDEYDDSDAKEKYNELRNYAITINQKHKNESIQAQKDKIIEMIQNNDVERFNIFISDTNSRILFISLNPQDIVTTLLSANAEIKQIFFQGLKSFFPTNLTNPSQNDILFLEKIKEFLDEYIGKQTKRTVDLANLIYSQQYLTKVLIGYKDLLMR